MRNSFELRLRLLLPVLAFAVTSCTLEDERCAVHRMLSPYAEDSPTYLKALALSRRDTPRLFDLSKEETRKIKLVGIPICVKDMECVYIFNTTGYIIETDRNFYCFERTSGELAKVL
jgi:hypothetical protein